MPTESARAVPFVDAVPFFDQAATFDRLWESILAHVEDVLDDGKYSHGRKVAEFEAALAAWTGARHAVAVNSGTDALVLLLRACGLRPGDEVVVPAFSFVATASSVVLAGGRPVFADIEPDGYGIDPKSVAAVAGPRTRMVMPVHLFCRMADMRGVLEVAAEHRLTVVEDSAEAIGMRWDGTHAGLLGAGGVLSFFPAKTLGAIGDAGAILTDDPEVAETAAALRHHGRRGRTLANFPAISHPTELPGVNSKMDDLQAAVLLAKLAALDGDIAPAPGVPDRPSHRDGDDDRDQHRDHRVDQVRGKRVRDRLRAVQVAAEDPGESVEEDVHAVAPTSSATRVRRLPRRRVRDHGISSRPISTSTTSTTIAMTHFEPLYRLWKIPLSICSREPARASAL